MATLGYELRQRREAKGVSLAQIAESTRIGVRFLQAIETDDYKALPGGLFNRSFIRAYARAVGLNEEEAITAYQKQTGAASPLSDAPLNVVPSYNIGSDTEINWVTPITVLVVIGVVLVGGWAVFNHFRRAASETKPPAVSASSPLPTTNSNPDGPPPVLTGGTPPRPPATTSPATGQPTAATAAIVLEFSASDNCFIQSNADGQKTTGFMLRSGGTYQLQANEKLLVRVGKVASIVAKVNGKEVTLPSPDGTKADVLISLKDGAPVLEVVKRKIPAKPKPTAEAAPTTTTTPSGDTQ